MRRYWINAVLFLFTILTTYLVGRAVYSVAIMTILLAHEMGHYLASRRYGVHSSLPYFIPLPLAPFGTLGAVIKSRGTIPSRRALFDIGAWGPLFGLVLTVPAVIIGLLLSEVVEVSQISGKGILLGDSPFFLLLQWLVLGKLPANSDVVLHPLAYAGWVGLFITALNLLPAGQLDGGHIIYSLFGNYSRIIFRLTLVGMALICLVYNIGWLLLVILLLIMGFRHPRPLDDTTPLDLGRKVLGIVAFCVFFTSFTPLPFPSLALGIGDILRPWLIP
jgi:membrane-associated protease RseP (regulator of RpoE activity)